MRERLLVIMRAVAGSTPAMTVPLAWTSDGFGRGGFCDCARNDEVPVRLRHARGQDRIAVRTVATRLSCVAPSLACIDMPW